MSEQPPSQPPPWPPAGYPGYPPYPEYPYQAPRPTNGFAIASLVLGIIWIYWLGSILAVIFGHVALGQIARNGDGGRGLAIAGLVLGYVGIGVLAVLLIVWIIIGGIALQTA